MNQISWFYLQNPFDNVTKGSFKRMLIMATDHHDKLLAASATSAQIGAIYQQFLPAFQAFKQTYMQTFASGAVYQGNTQMVENLFSELSGRKIKQWDAQIQSVFLDDTPQYKMLLPNNRGPFQTGTYEGRIQSVLTLETNLALFPQLAAVLLDVSSFRQMIEQSRTVQQGYEKQSSDLTKQVEDSRVELAQVMHFVFGSLIAIYFKQPWQVETFYELKYLRTSATATNNPTFQNYTVTANQRIALFKGQLKASNSLIIKNIGTVAITCFTSNNDQATPPIDALILAPNQSQTVFADELSDGNGFDTLILLNNDISNGLCAIALE